MSNPSDGHERSRSPEIQEKYDADQPGIANDERKKVLSLETRRPQRDCLQARDQHVPSAHASQTKNIPPSVSNADTVPLAGRPALQTYARLFVPFIQLTHLFFSELRQKTTDSLKILRPFLS